MNLGDEILLETGANQIQGVTFFVEIQRHSKSPHVLCKQNFPRNPVIYYCADKYMWWSTTAYRAF